MNRYYLLGVLTVVSALNFADRSLLAILIEDVKSDLNLSDTQIGILTGLAFTTFYAVLGLPLGWLADKGNRIRLVSITTAVFSAATILCGMAANFVQLLMARIALAAGEAGTMPAANSLIADAFDRAERPRAMAIFVLGGALAFLIGFGGGGILNEVVGWRATFFIIGSPGLLASLVVFLTLREMRKRKSVALRTLVDTSSLWNAASKLMRIRSYRNLCAAFTISGTFSVSVGLWQPAFFLRTYDVGTAELGLWLAVIFATTFSVGALLGGEAVSRFASRNEARQFRMMALLMVGVAVLSFAVYAVDSLALALSLVALSSLAAGALYTPFLSGVQAVTPPDSRGMAMAVLLFLSQLFGAGIGAVLIGGLSDLLSPFFGDQSLRVALLVIMPGYGIVAWIYWRVSKIIMKDVRRADMTASVEIK